MEKVRARIVQGTNVTPYFEMSLDLAAGTPPQRGLLKKLFTSNFVPWQGTFECPTWRGIHIKTFQVDRIELEDGRSAKVRVELKLDAAGANALAELTQDSVNAGRNIVDTFFPEDEKAGLPGTATITIIGISALR